MSALIIGLIIGVLTLIYIIYTITKKADNQANQ